MAEEFIGKAKNIVFIGEAGSGKTETAVNLALRLARVGGRAVHFSIWTRPSRFFARGTARWSLSVME